MSPPVTIRFADVGGVRTRYYQAGEGPPLILIHGLGVSADIFIRNIAALAERHAVYAPDILGHGFTDSADYRGDAPQACGVRHLLQWIDGLGLEQYDLAGSSLGALLAGLLYFKAPERVRNLVLIGSGAVFVDPESVIPTLQGALANASVAMGNPTLDSCRKRMAAIFHDPAKVPEEILVAQLTSYALPDRFDAYKSTVAGMIEATRQPQHQVFGRLEKITARTLVMTGGSDPRATVPTHRAGRDRIPGARMVVIEQAGHLSFMEHPDLFNATLLRFLGGEDVGD